MTKIFKNNTSEDTSIVKEIGVTLPYRSLIIYIL